ncbi:MAG: sporulation protein YabP [Ruminococcaceae bacterium]|nr:sporulation protein YabP [Oscillospiraceae bacterium]
METNNTLKGTVTLIDRRILKMDGVSDIAAFDEECVILNTGIGRITVEGTGLKIESLSECGDILIKGNISGIFSSESEPIKRGFFGRIFG